MRSLIQRVTAASITINENPQARIGAGLLALVCVMHGDDEDSAARLARKVTRLRIFEDDAGNMNLSVLETGGSILVVSQFTLAANTQRGNRPSFTQAAAPTDAIPLYAHFINCLRETGLTVAAGQFGERMQVSLVNDGPVTLWLAT